MNNGGGWEGGGEWKKEIKKKALNYEVLSIRNESQPYMHGGMMGQDMNTRRNLKKWICVIALILDLYFPNFLTNHKGTRVVCRVFLVVFNPHMDEKTDARSFMIG